MKSTLFKNFNIAAEDLGIPAILELIRSDRHRQQILNLRELLAAGKEEEYNKQKRYLPAFTPSGLFEGGRKMEFLKEYTGLLILDIDKIPTDLYNNVRAKAREIVFSYAVFTSPSGNGLKILVRVNTSQHQHRAVFNEVKKFYENALNVPVDPSGKDITRLCFLSWDPDIYVNTAAQVFRSSAGQVSDQIEAVIQQIEQQQVDITNGYSEWLRICFALIDALGQGARQPFHRISRFHHKYNPQDCDSQFDHCLNSRNSGVTVSTFFHFAKEAGITLTGTTPVLHRSKTAVTQTTASARKAATDPRNTAGATDPITGKQTDEQPPAKKSGTNKFHLVRDYLTEHFDIRYNSVSTNFEYKEKDQDSYEPMNENDIFVKMQLDGLSFSLTNLLAFLKSSMVPRYNPFTQYFEALPPWDEKTDHITRLASFVNVKSDVRGRFDNHFKKWLVRAVKCALVDTYFNKQAFILVHDKQNSGKSTFCRFLCPPDLKNYIAENLSIDKDSRILLTTNLLINLDELSTLSKVEINSLKSLFSKDKINDRLPYDRKNSIIPRRASFIGSTNQAMFLNDESGSVRWLCFQIESIDWSYKDQININDVWAQAYHLFKTNFPCDLTPDEIKENEEYNRQFNITTPEFELIHKYLTPATRECHDTFMTATDILIHLSDQTLGKVKLNTNNVGKALKLLSFAREKKYPEKNYGYYVFKKLQ